MSCGRANDKVGPCGRSADFQPNTTNFSASLSEMVRRIRGSIPTGLHHSAQGCEERAFAKRTVLFYFPLGAEFGGRSNLQGLQCVRFAIARLGTAMQPFQGWRTCCTVTQGSSRARNPGLNDSIPLGWRCQKLVALETCATALSIALMSGGGRRSS